MTSQVKRTVAVFAVLLIPASAMAQGYSWCYTNYPDAIFCDDFDRYCNASPYPPYPCAPGTWSIAQFRNQGWDPVYTPLSAGGCSEAWLEDTWPYDPVPVNGVVSSPFSVKFPNQADSKVGVNVRNLTTDIQRKWGNQVFFAVATDENPLQLDFTFYGQTVASKTQAANVFLELATDTDWAMTNYVWGPTSPTTGKEYPILCAQGPGEPVGCPPLNTAPLRSSLAVGPVAFLDRDYLNSPDQAPKTPYLCVYDGRYWWQLRDGQFPGSGAFTLHEREHYIRLTIWPTFFRVEMTVPRYGQYSWCDVPRQYRGGFNTLRMGFGKHCMITAATGWTACQSNFRCPNGSFGAGAPAFDNVVLYGGEPQRAPYIIAHPQPQAVPVTGTATFTVSAGGTPPLSYQWQKNFVNLTDGGHYSGVTTATLTVSDVGPEHAANYRCLVESIYGTAFTDQAALTVVPWPGDFDGDLDVDLTDFAFFQLCFNGPNRPPAYGACEPADMNGDGDVDLLDFGEFQTCYNGPNRLPACPQ